MKEDCSCQGERARQNHIDFSLKPYISPDGLFLSKLKRTSRNSAEEVITHSTYFNQEIHFASRRLPEHLRRVVK